jgi:integrase
MECFVVMEPEQLWLFDPDALDEMAHIQMQRLKFAASVRADNTREAYQIAWRDFAAWCRRKHFSSLPARSETVALYITHVLTSGRRVATANLRVSAIAHAHKAAGYPSPINPDVRAVIRGARRINKDRSIAKRAITIEDLVAICKRKTDDGTLASVRDRALLTLGFAAALRRSELVALDLRDVAFAPKGLLVTIRHSKSDPFGESQSLGISRGLRRVTCPVRSVEDWLKIRGRQPGPLLLRLGAKGEHVLTRRLCAKAVSRIVKYAVRSIGLDPAQYSSHSLRAGCATAANLNGASDLSIMERTRHRSLLMVKRYLRHNDPFAVDPLKGAL